MARANKNFRLRVERRSVHDLTDTQIETFAAFGRRRAELVDQIEQATRAGDDARVLELARLMTAEQDSLLPPAA